MNAQTEFKKGQKVNATTRSGAIVPGTVVATKPGARGSFVEVKHDTGNKSYRPSALTPA